MDVVREQEMVFPEDVRLLPFQGMDEPEAGGVIPEPWLPAVLVEKDVLAREKRAFRTKDKNGLGALKA